MDQNVQIVPMQISMLPSVVEIASMTLGSSFVNEEILKSNINLCAKIGSNIVAYATTKFVSSEDLAKILKNKKLLQEEKSVGYIDSIAVHEDYEGRGIGTLLLKSTMIKLNENKIGYAVMAGWKNKDQVNIRTLALREGFKEEFEIKNFWRDDSLEYNFECTVCKKPPCLCSAVIFSKDLQPT